MTHPYTHTIARELQLRPEQVAAVIGLLDEDNTIPFIARYRKEATGGLDEEQLRDTKSRLDQLRKLDDRRSTILESIAEQGVLTPELKARIEAAQNLTALEDLYQPYKPRRRTRADAARELGLQGLADLILSQATEPASSQAAARDYLSAEVATPEAALSGARDIVAEAIADHPDVRSSLREKALQWGSLQSSRIKSAEDEKGVYKNYYDFDFRIDRLRPHQVLALNRGEAEKVLRVRVSVPERDWQGAISAHFPTRRGSPFAAQLIEAQEDAAARLLLPAIERDVRRSLTEDAGRHAVQVFASNLRSLLSQPPLAGYVVLGIDPGFRTGCKLAVVDATGKLLDTGTIYPHPPQNRRQEALDDLGALIRRYGVNLVAIGNGTASRETERLAADLIAGFPEVRYLIVSEAGASVYSASPLARSELPDLDVSIRGAVSIARRIQDPLAELVKIDPKSIGVGMYQHDVDQKMLTAGLDAVVESVVNRVGVDANTASPALLGYVAGIGPRLAEKIVEHRDAQGPFHSRSAIRQVSGLGPKAFEQAAGFLRIRDGDNPLDAGAIHPESYPIAAAVMASAGLDPQASPEVRAAALDRLLAGTTLKALAERLGTGEPTLADILDQIIRPGRDPREDLPVPILRSDVLSMADLKMGMVLKGTVRNVVDFGAFVDIGVKQDGLLHRSQLPAGAELSVGDVIDVAILQVEPERGRISLGWPAR